MSGALVGLSLLVIGDSHFVYPGSLSTHLHDMLRREGATVATYSACGVGAGAWVVPRGVPCGTATRVGAGNLQTNRTNTARSFSIDELVQRHRPNLVIVGIGDTMGGYSQREMPRQWITDQVRTLTTRFQATSMPCIWVGPTWGTEGGPFFKTFDRAKELSDYLATQVAPCAYIDSTAFSRPGAWPTYDGQHHTAAGYANWARSLTPQIIALINSVRRR
ncbi:MULTISPECIES: SGNH/GDSL hydrolase family protein [Roseomonadaceae]|uniref:SGNH/GDSL hydrolase family protein n=1 Tax=Falsiroseomonas oleicola TaxID=2801474 RepID=A0ABS6H3N6_9PROT|nr:SGNH/GDSL hydrolase family protein [Roseomonas oleicola]MBU8543271.1 SGNH/GDSL hydrolase family protein [Roseomonas oleicola]